MSQPTSPVESTAASMAENTFNTTMDHIESLHLEATQLIMRRSRARRDLARALVLADKAMEMARDIQLELALAEADHVFEIEGWNEVAAAALVEKCGRMQAHCFDLLAESYSPNVEGFEHAAYRQSSHGSSSRGIHGLVGEDNESEDAKKEKERKKQEQKERKQRRAQEEELELAGALFDLELGDEENAQAGSSSGASAAPTVTRRSIRFADEGAPGLRRQKGQYFDDSKRE